MNKTNWKLPLIIVAAVLAFIIFCIFGVQSSQNRAISLEESVETAKSDISVQLQRRINLLTELAQCVKQYDAHEYETLNDVISKRGTNMTDQDVESITAQINAVAENYPQLQSADNYKEFMNELSTTENLVAQYKSAYNSSIKNYRRYVRKFPTRIFLDMTGYEVIDYQLYTSDATDNEPLDLFE